MKQAEEVSTIIAEQVCNDNYLHSLYAIGGVLAVSILINESRYKELKNDIEEINDKLDVVSGRVSRLIHYTGMDSRKRYKNDDRYDDDYFDEDMYYDKRRKYPRKK